MNPLLSICIPTYNRGKFIGQTIESIVSQAGQDVEIVISDNASTDDTAAIVESYRKKFPRLTYCCAENNMGADRNYLRVIELAKGKYCWFMGSDDVLEPGSITRLLKIIKNNPGLAGISVNRYAYDFTMTRHLPERPVAGGAYSADTLFSDAETTYVALGEYFGYLPGQIVDRALWSEIVSKHDVNRFLNAYVHIFVIGEMLKARPRWLYCAQRCVGWRSGNDSFLGEGIYKRLALDVVGYEDITVALFGKGSKAYREIMSIVSTVHVRYALMGAKLNGANHDFFRKARKLTTKHYAKVPSFWIKTFPIFLIPSSLMRGLRTIYRLTLKPVKQRNLLK